MTTIEELNFLSLNGVRLNSLYFTKCVISDAISSFCSKKQIDIFGSTIIYGIISKSGNFIKMYRLLNDVYYEDTASESELSRYLMSLNINDYLNFGNFKIHSYLKNKNNNYYQYSISFETENIKIHLWKSTELTKNISYPTHVSSFCKEYNKVKNLKGFALFSEFKFPLKVAKYIILDEKLNVQIISVNIDNENKIWFKKPDNFDIHFIKEIDLPII